MFRAVKTFRGFGGYGEQKPWPVRDEAPAASGWAVLMRVDARPLVRRWPLLCRAIIQPEPAFPRNQSQVLPLSLTTFNQGDPP